VLTGTGHAGPQDLLSGPKVRDAARRTAALRRPAVPPGLGSSARRRDNLSNMNLKSASNCPRPGQHGFTLVELMIAVVVVALLASIALPSFMDSIRKSRRSDAFNAIAQVQQMQERWRGIRDAYAADAVLTEPWSPANPASAPGLGVPRLTANGYYSLALSDTGATRYTVTATAEASTSQAADGNCKVLAARLTDGNLAYGSGAAAAAFPDANRCWAR
jgi:type IV pilus assembly protein PilE